MSDNADISMRLGFMQIDSETQKSLRDVAGVINAALPDVLRGFYEHVEEWPDAAQFFQNSAVMKHAATKQIMH